MNLKTNLILCGGGIKGIIHVGILYALEQFGYLKHFTNFAGTSIGGMILALLIIGYGPTELFEFVKAFDFDKLKKIKIMNIDKFGLDSGEQMTIILKKLIKNKTNNENITLSELYTQTNKKLTLVACCLNTLTPCYISHENFPDIPLFLALRMTTCIPFIYCPIIYNDKMYVDGGCLNNYPISLFKDDLNNSIGVLFIEKIQEITNIDNFELYISRLLQCFTLKVFNDLNKKYESCTIKITPEQVNFADFNVTNETKDKLFLLGYKHAYQHLNPK